MSKCKTISIDDYVDEVDSWYEVFNQAHIKHIEKIMQDIVWMLMHNDLPRGVPLILYQMYCKLEDIKKTILETQM